MANKTKRNTIYENEIVGVQARIKWYNPEKGYGFLTLDDDSEDIFLHFSVLDKYGAWGVQEDDHIICDIAPGKGGPRVLNIIGIKFIPREIQTSNDCDLEDSEKIKGIVKWFNPFKGYGFITPEKGGEEIFLHSSVLHAIGYKYIKPGTRVFMKCAYMEEKYEVTSLEVID